MKIKVYRDNKLSLKDTAKIYALDIGAKAAQIALDGAKKSVSKLDYYIVNH